MWVPKKRIDERIDWLAWLIGSMIDLRHGSFTFSVACVWVCVRLYVPFFVQFPVNKGLWCDTPGWMWTDLNRNLGSCTKKKGKGCRSSSCESRVRARNNEREFVLFFLNPPKNRVYANNGCSIRYAKQMMHGYILWEQQKKTEEQNGPHMAVAALLCSVRYYIPF